MKPRTVCWFSCGAASAVATKIAITEHVRKTNAGELVVAYCEVREEHPDNRRFLADCQRWFGMPITTMGNDTYGRSTFEVFRRRRYLVGPSGAHCTAALKKHVREKFERHDDIQVFGYTAEEQGRVDRFLDANPLVHLSLPLIEASLSKADCLAMVKNAGIELPAMYKLGYTNNNCVGCVKGGVGYWNKIRVDFPDVFEQMAQMEDYLGRTICKVGGERISLRQLPPDIGDHADEPNIECSIFCHMAEQRMR